MDGLNHNNFEKGAALIVTLIIILLLTVIGVAALNSSSSSTRIVTGTTAGEMSFEAAQSIINATEKAIRTQNLDSELLSQILAPRQTSTLYPINVCLSGAGELELTECSKKNGQMSAKGQLIVDGRMAPMPNWSIDNDGGFGFFLLYIKGEGRLERIGAERTNIKSLRVFGPNIHGNELNLLN